MLSASLSSLLTDCMYMYRLGLYGISNKIYSDAPLPTAVTPGPYAQHLSHPNLTPQASELKYTCRFCLVTGTCICDVAYARIALECPSDSHSGRKT